MLKAPKRRASQDSFEFRKFEFVLSAAGGLGFSTSDFTEDVSLACSTHFRREIPEGKEKNSLSNDKIRRTAERVPQEPRAPV